MPDIAAHEPINQDFTGKDIISIDQFTPADVERLFAEADAMQQAVTQDGGSDLLKGKLMASLFYEPSTRTSSSFLAAMQRLGGGIIPINEVNYSSVAKGENLEDTVRTLECYSDVIVLRHGKIGAAALAAAQVGIPLINAGDGAGEHPTQALLDLFTIQKELGRIDGLNITLLGDLKNGRTVHSLARLLAMYKSQLNYVSPNQLRMPAELVATLDAAGVQQYQTDSLDEVIGDSDVLYVTRVQKERMVSDDEYKEVKGSYVITPETMTQAKPNMALMHPLPRVGEISSQVDSDERSAYFRQMEYGMYVRMALLALVLGKTTAPAASRQAEAAQPELVRM